MTQLPERLRLAVDYTVVVAMYAHQGLLYLVDVWLKRKGWR